MLLNLNPAAASGLLRRRAHHAAHPRFEVVIREQREAGARNVLDELAKLLVPPGEQRDPQQGRSMG